MILLYREVHQIDLGQIVGAVRAKKPKRLPVVLSPEEVEARISISIATIRETARKADICKPVTPHVFRHCFATHVLQAGYDIRTVQTLLGHASVETTMIHTHVLNRGGRGVRSPLDRP